jgi:flagellar biogenesis protein FliO
LETDFMQFLTGLFGGSGNTIVTVVLALGIVLVLIVLGLWLLKLVFKASSTAGRGRNRRLSVTDSLMLDPKRQLLIVRRDDVEHLILTGGAQDVVIESGIPVVAHHPARPAVRRGSAPDVVPPQRAANSVLPARRRGAPQVEEQAPAPTALERLRDLGRPIAERRSTSLRHTGLMRPVSVMEPAPVQNSQNPETGDADSATTMPNGTDGQAAGEGDNQFEQYRSERSADGN